MTAAYDPEYDDAAAEQPRPPAAGGAPVRVVDDPRSDAATLSDLATPVRETESEAAPAWNATRLSGRARREPTQDTERGGRRGGSDGTPERPVRRLGGLDGLRAIAVMSVVVFHLDFSLLPGGFLGVDVFFVISGFLITNLIATEILSTGRLRLGNFYLRRARRLLPTVLALLAVVTVVGSTIWRDQLATLRGGVLSSLTYVTNWWLIADHQSYFVATGRPTMVQHLWSLAIEEQFYLVWSAAIVLITGTAMWLGKRREVDPARRMRVVVGVALALAVTSTLIMAWYAHSEDLPYGSISNSRVYFGSDTHTMGLFLGSAAGAAVALFIARRRRPAAVAAPSRAPYVLATDLVGVAALAVAVFQFVDVNEYVPGLYRGGFLAFDAVVLVAILCGIRRGSIFARVLDMRPMRWLGQRSYSIYVWHWPVCVVTRPDQDVHGSLFWLNVARLLLILGLSALSYHFIEVPLRSGQLRAWRTERRRHHRGLWEAGAVFTAIVAGISLAVAATPGATGSPLSGPVPIPATHSSPYPQPLPHSSPPPSRHASPGTHGSGHPGRSTAPNHGTGNAPAAKLSISAFGDSVVLGAEYALQARTAHLKLDAVEGRQASDVLDDIDRQVKAHTLEPDVLIHIGDNGVIDPDHLRRTLSSLADRRRVLLMIVRVPRDWQDPNNQIIKGVGGSFPNVRIVDWHAMSSGRSDWLYDDGIHLRPAGALAYTQIVLQAFHEP